LITEEKYPSKFVVTAIAQEVQSQCIINGQDNNSLNRSAEVRQLLKAKRKLVDILSEQDEGNQELESASEGHSLPDSDMPNVNQSSVTMHAMGKAARTIEETDDPAVSDKRRRNRIAAEKCRNRRKERQFSLEAANRELSQQVDNLSKRLAEISEESRRHVQQLQLQNRSLKNENKILHSRLTAPPTGHAHFMLSEHKISHSQMKQSKLLNGQKK
jgi:hypothetical protein